MSKTRIGPMESATLFQIGTIKKGMDNNDWIVTATYKGVHRWQKINQNNDRKADFFFTEIYKLKKIGSFNVTGDVGVGDTYYKRLNLKKGIYDAYKIDDNLMIISSNIKVDKNYIYDIDWSKSCTIGVDTGTFGFFDTNIVDQLIKITDEIHNYKSKKNNKYVPELDYTSFTKDESIITTRQIAGVIDEDLPEKLINLKFGVISETGIGDGWFNCYTNGNNKALLIGGYTSDNK